MKVTDHEIRDITKHLEAGKPLPDKFRFLLFEEKREVEPALARIARLTPLCDTG